MGDRRVVITGALGVIGSLVARKYAELGNVVVGIDKGTDPRHAFNAGHILPPSVEMLDLDLAACGSDAIRDVVDGASFVLHAAAHTGIPHSAQDPAGDFQDNVVATYNLLEALRSCSCPPPTVVLSSVKPYDLSHVAQLDTPHVTESYPVRCDEPYAATKLSQSALSQAWALSFDLPIAVLRCSNLYGPAACHGPRHGWLTWFCIAAATGLPITIDGSGVQARDMLWWRDVWWAAELLRAHLDDKRLLGSVFNLGGGKHNVIGVRTAAELLLPMSESMAARLPWPHGPMTCHDAPARRNDDMQVVTATGELQNATGWQPSVDVNAGIKRVAAWAFEHREALRAIYAPLAPAIPPHGDDCADTPF